jgi:HD-like signal output (HDOD) protein
MQSTFEIFHLLSEIELTCDLSDAARQELAHQCYLEVWTVKQQMRAEEMVDDYLLLIDGRIARRENNLTARIENQKGNVPPVIFGHAIPGTRAITLSPCTVLRIPVAALDAARSENVEVNDIELDATESHLLAELYELIGAKRLQLPVRPEIALKIQQLTNDQNSSIDTLTEIIQGDGAVAGGLLHATNRPLFRAAKPIRSIRDAVVRLGFRNTRMLTTNLALRQTFKARYTTTREAMKQVWAEGVLCSAFAYLLADTLGVLHRERALLAGLVADIGAVPIIQFIERRDPEPQRAMIDALVARLSPITGMLVINYWELGEDLIAVAEHFHDWTYHAKQPDYASLVLLARWAMLHREGKPHPPAETVPAFRVLGVPRPAPGDGIATLDHLDRELQSLQDMFTL